MDMKSVGSIYYDNFVSTFPIKILFCFALISNYDYNYFGIKIRFPDRLCCSCQNLFTKFKGLCQSKVVCIHVQ